MAEMRAGILQHKFDLAMSDLSRIGIKGIRHEPLSKHTTFRIGGPAELFISPKSTEEFVRILDYAWQRELDTQVIGYGSKLLVRDSGFKGLVIHTGHLSSFSFDAEGNIAAEAGVFLNTVSLVAAYNGWSGLEFVSGIPATLGGAIATNVGSGSESIGKLATNVQVMSPSLGIIWLNNGDCCFGYRHSVFRGSNNIVLGAILKLRPGQAPKQILRETRRRFAGKSASQPLAARSAGCIFLNSSGVSAARLIEEAGLKGLKCGGATVSSKHAGFIVNTNNASADDVLRLIDNVGETVLRKTGLSLGLEIQILGK